MGLRINQNIAAANAYRNLNVTDGQMAKSLEKLSSGFRINRAADDAAGLSISEGMRSQIGGLKVAVRNAQDGISLVQTAEGALTEVHSLLQRARDLAVQSANTGANDSAARTAASTEVTEIVNEVNRISAATAFGGKNLLDGSTGAFTFQVGSGTASTDQVTVNISSMSASGLSLTGTGAAATSADLSGTVNGGQTILLTYNTGASGASDVSTTINLAAGTYDTTSAVGREALLAGINDGLEAAGVQNAVHAELVGGSTSGTYRLKLSTVGTGGSATINVTGGTLISAGANDINIASGVNSGSGAGSIATQIASGNTAAITTIDTAISTVSSQRATLGAYQNRFEHTIANLNVTVENLSASESRIRDTDMAAEMTAYTRTQILTQAGTAMLAQANQSQQGVLQLLRG